MQKTTSRKIIQILKEFFLKFKIEVRPSTENLKLKYYQKLSNKRSNDTFKGMCYWSILKNFLNSKRIPCILSLIRENKFVNDFHLKSLIFNSPFAKHCSPMENNSRIPLETFQAIKKTMSDAKLVRRLHFVNN